MDGGGRTAAHVSRRWSRGARGPANSARGGPGDSPRDGTMKTLQAVWLHIEQDFEASLLIFLEQLFLVEPSAALTLRSLERRPKPPEVIPDAPAQLEPSLSMRIKTVATHLGRAIRTACDCLQDPSDPASSNAEAWQCLAPGFRSLARALSAQGWGCAFLDNVGISVERSLAAINGRSWPELAETWWPEMWGLIRGEMEGELVRDSPQATTLPNSQKDEGRLNFWDIALLDLFGEGRGHEPEAEKVAPAIPLTTPSKSSSHACSHRWGCKYKCSFVGSFAEVEEHERICLKGQGPKEHKDENKKMQIEQARATDILAEQSGVTRDGARADVGDSKSIVNEQDPSRRQRFALPTVRLPQAHPKFHRRQDNAREDAFECKHRCGFTGGFSVVLSHEASCKKREMAGQQFRQRATSEDDDVSTQQLQRQQEARGARSAKQRKPSKESFSESSVEAPPPKPHRLDLFETNQGSERESDPITLRENTKVNEPPLSKEFQATATLPRYDEESENPNTDPRKRGPAFREQILAQQHLLSPRARTPVAGYIRQAFASFASEGCNSGKELLDEVTSIKDAREWLQHVEINSDDQTSASSHVVSHVASSGDDNLLSSGERVGKDTIPDSTLPSQAAEIASIDEGRASQDMAAGSLTASQTSASMNSIAPMSNLDEILGHLRQIEMLEADLEGKHMSSVLRSSKKRASNLVAVMERDEELGHVDAAHLIELEELRKQLAQVEAAQIEVGQGQLAETGEELDNNWKASRSFSKLLGGKPVMGQRQPTLSEEVKADDNSLDMQKIEHLSKPTSLDMARSSQNDWTLDKAHSQKSSSMSLPESLNKRGWSCTEGSHTRESIELDAQLWRQQKLQAYDGTHSNIMEVETSFCGDRLNRTPSMQSLQQLPTLERGTARPYQYMNAQYILMQDILEDGAPPVPRSIAAQRHMEVTVFVKQVLHLPMNSHSQSVDETSYYCVNMNVHDQNFQTNARRGSVASGCKWFERFHIDIDETMLSQSNDSTLEGLHGPVLAFNLYDCGKYSAKSAIGQVEMPLFEIPDVDAEGLHVTLKLQRTSDDKIQSEELFGEDGEATTLEISFHSQLGRENRQWKPPTLQKTLSSCDEGKIVLNPPRNPISIVAALRANESLNASAAVGGEGKSVNRTFFGLIPSPGIEVDDTHLGNDDILDWDFAESHVNDEEDIDRMGKDLDYHWREQLEIKLDSLAVNLVVIILVLIDIVNVIVYNLVWPVPEDEADPIPSVVLSAVVITLLFIELTLRQIAMGRRFWNSWANIFDTFVVWISLAIFIVRQASTTAQVKDLQGVVFLRVVRSVAVTLRVVRVLINLRRARKLSGHVAKKLRSTVSQNKRRYNKQGFDLDLTYITNRVIAMGTPAFGKHSSYRNDIHVVSRFMSFRHYGCFFIFNLCDTYTSSDGVTGNYNPGMLFNQVQRIPFEDHGPPLMSEMIQFCEEAQLWLLKDPRNVVACHCKGGKGRTGVMTAALILWSGHRKSALDALELFTFRRTANYNADLGLDGNYQSNKLITNLFPTAGREANQTVEGPSQIRYVHYLEAVLYSGVDVLAMHKLFLPRISLPVGELHASKPLYISVVVSCMRYPIFDTINLGNEQVWTLGGNCGDVVTLPINVIVWGDVRVQIFRHKTLSRTSQRKLFAFVVFNTAFYRHETHLTLPKSKIDVINKDKGNKKVDEDFYIRIQLDSEADNELLRLEAKTRQVFYKYGELRLLKAGDCLIEGSARGSAGLKEEMYLIAAGSVEGVVNDVAYADGTVHHPLGRSASEACLLGKGDTQHSADYTRVPNICILGVGMVVGQSQFLLKQGIMKYRARTDCEVYTLKRPKLESAAGQRSPDDHAIEGVAPQELADFYRGMSFILGAFLSRVRMEAVRLGSLAAKNDRQTVLADTDESEQLRSRCISLFGLPMNEKLLTRVKCSSMPPKGGPVRLRMLLFYNYIVLDPAFFGPNIASNAEVWSLRQLHSVSPGDDDAYTTLLITLLGERVHGLDIAANVSEYRFTFTDAAKTRHLYYQISSMCKKAEEIRQHERVRPFETPIMSALLETCSVVHRVKKGDVLKEASSKSSLFLVCSGEIRLQVKGGDVFRIVREGMCFGEINFSLNCTAGHYICIANSQTILLEISHAQLHRALKQEQNLSAQFFYIFCQACEREISATMEETFPGTWNRKYNLESSLANPQTSLSQPPMRRNSALRRNSRTQRNSLSGKSVSMVLSGISPRPSCRSPHRAPEMHFSSRSLQNKADSGLNISRSPSISDEVDGSIHGPFLSRAHSKMSPRTDRERDGLGKQRWSEENARVEAVAAPAELV